MFDDVCSTFLLKECFAFDQTIRPKMLKRLAGFSTLLNLQMLYNNVRSFSRGLSSQNTGFSRDVLTKIPQKSFVATHEGFLSIFLLNLNRD